MENQTDSKKYNGYVIFLMSYLNLWGLHKFFPSGIIFPKHLNRYKKYLNIEEA